MLRFSQNLLLLLLNNPLPLLSYLFVLNLEGAVLDCGQELMLYLALRNLEGFLDYIVAKFILDQGN